MPAAYAFGRGRKGPSGRGTGGDGGAGLRGLWGRENFFDFFVDRGAAFWQCAFLPRGCSSVGRALEWHSRGQEFNSPQLHQKGNQGLRKRRPFFRFCPRKSGSTKPELSRAPAFSYPAGRRAPADTGGPERMPGPWPDGPCRYHRSARLKGPECACAHT